MKILRPFLFPVLLFGAMPLQAQQVDFKPASPVVKLMPILMDNLGLLNLSSEQLAKVRKISRKSFADLEYLNAEYHVAKSELREVLLDFNGTSAQADKLIQQLAEMEKKRLILTSECAMGLKQILTAEQHQELIEIATF